MISLTSKSNYPQCSTIPLPPKKIPHRCSSITLSPKSNYHRPQTISLTSKSNYPQCSTIPLPPKKMLSRRPTSAHKKPDTCERCSASIRSFRDERERLTVSPPPADGYQDCRYRRHLRCRHLRLRLCRRRVSFRRRCRRRASSALPSRGGGCPACRRPSPVFGA